MSHSHAAPTDRKTGAVTVSQPHDPAEQQADRAADVVARGGSVAGWSFGSVASVSASVHRDEAGKGDPSNEEKYKAAAKKTGEAALKTEAGKEIIKKVEDLAPVKEARKALDTTAGKVVAGGVVAAGIGGLAAAGQPLPIAIPDIKIAPGVELGVHVEGPLNHPTGGGITLTFKEQGGSGKKGPSESDKIAADTRRLRAMDEMFKPGAQKAQERADEKAAIAASFARSSGLRPVIPLAPGAQPVVVETPKADQPAAGEKKDDAAPVQREAASATEHAALDTRGAQGVAAGGGRPLEPATRRSMETRFGHDFGSVRIHDDAQGHAAAEGVDAHAFTVGDHIGFAAGHPSQATPAGQHLLAHELAHVVQQRGGAGLIQRKGGGVQVQRVGIFERIARFFGGGTFSTEELAAYLKLIRATRRIEDDNDSDNKARDIVRRFLAHETAFAILDVPDRVLLIREMLSGFTGDDDEQAILELLNEAIPQERAAIVKQVGIGALRDAFDGEEFRRLVKTVESGEEDQALASGSDWTVDGVLEILERQGDVSVIKDLIRLKWTIVRFDTAFDTWRYAGRGGRVESNEVTGLLGNTVRETRTIRLRSSLSSEKAARTLFHELHHAFAQEPTSDEKHLEDEVQARVAAEQFNIRHGFPPTEPEYRRPDGSVDEEFIRKEIHDSPHYNPTGRQRIGRRYVNEKPTTGWRVRSAVGASAGGRK